MTGLESQIEGKVTRNVITRKGRNQSSLFIPTRICYQTLELIESVSHKVENTNAA